MVGISRSDMGHEQWLSIILDQSGRSGILSICQLGLLVSLTYLLTRSESPELSILVSFEATDARKKAYDMDSLLSLERPETKQSPTGHIEPNWRPF
jgi:hypothetical protein